MVRSPPPVYWALSQTQKNMSIHSMMKPKCHVGSFGWMALSQYLRFKACTSNVLHSFSANIIFRIQTSNVTPQTPSLAVGSKLWASFLRTSSSSHLESRRRRLNRLFPLRTKDPCRNSEGYLQARFCYCDCAASFPGLEPYFCTNFRCFCLSWFVTEKKPRTSLSLHLPT